MSCVNVVVETPKGSSQKYDYDPDSHFFKMKKILSSGMVFPYDFGFVPKTKGEDGDPLDVIVISEFNSFPGIMMKCRIFGGIIAKQSDKAKGRMTRNDRFLAIPRCSNIFQNVKSIEDLPNEIVSQLEEFFVDYNKLEGKKFKAVRKIDSREASKLVTVQDD